MNDEEILHLGNKLEMPMRPDNTMVDKIHVNVELAQKDNRIIKWNFMANIILHLIINCVTRAFLVFRTGTNKILLIN